jgi:23S rRNA pseudouridine1911/1915/1917 synthase
MIANVKAKVRDELDGERFDVAAAALFPELSRKRVKTVIDAGGAYVNKRRVRLAKVEVKSGDMVELFWEEAPRPSDGVPRAGPGALPGPRPAVGPSRTPVIALLKEEHFVHVEKDFLVVSKPAGLPSQATLTSSTDTVLHAIATLRPQDFPLASLHLVHRLDKETSGLLIVARTKAARAHFEEAFRERTVKKVYDALCFFAPMGDEGTVDFPLVKDSSRPNAYLAVRGARSRADAKSARTAYEVVKRFPKARACLIRLAPETGRTHQIRVHMQALGCPLLGDKTYALGVVGHAFAQTALRHMLHAARLSFVGPRGDTYTLDAPYPADFAACLAALERTEG